jgi:hypothetical protein
LQIAAVRKKALTSKKMPKGYRSFSDDISEKRENVNSVPNNVPKLMSA